MQNAKELERFDAAGYLRGNAGPRDAVFEF
jgi:hypothetical protein